MHLYSNEEDDDDVSVLTSSTNLTKDSAVSNSSFVKLARENLERLILESKNSGEDDGKSLTRISEEGGSQNSSCNSKSRSSKSSSVESDETKTIDEKEEDYNDDDDDDTISLAESILVSANKVLSNIGSSPYYAGRSKKLDTYESPLPQPNPKQSSPMKQPNKTNNTDDTGNCSKNIYTTKKEFTPSKKISNDQHGNQLEVSSNFLSSYFSDENVKPSTNRSNHNNDSSIAKSSSSSITKYGSSYKSSKTVSNDQSLQKLESETKHLQLLLKEQQLETKKASQSLGLSINKANALLERLSADRNA